MSACSLAVFSISHSGAAFIVQIAFTYFYKPVEDKIDTLAKSKTLSHADF